MFWKWDRESVLNNFVRLFSRATKARFSTATYFYACRRASILSALRAENDVEQIASAENFELDSTFSAGVSRPYNASILFYVRKAFKINIRLRA